MAQRLITRIGSRKFIIHRMSNDGEIDGFFPATFSELVTGNYPTIFSQNTLVAEDSPAGLDVLMLAAISLHTEWIGQETEKSEPKYQSADFRFLAMD